jgi:GDP-D-mannose dehydratase
MSKLAMRHMARIYLEKLPIMIMDLLNFSGHGEAFQFLTPKLVNHFARRAQQIELGNLDAEREFNDVRMDCVTHGVPVEVYNVRSVKPQTLQYMIHLLYGIAGHTKDVQLNPRFMPANEKHRLCGEPSKISACIGSLKAYPLAPTLAWMLEKQS